MKLKVFLLYSCTLLYAYVINNDKYTDIYLSYSSDIDVFDDDLGDILELLLGMAGKWLEITTSLRLKSDEMAIIARDNKDSKTCLRLAMIEWLKLNYNWQRNGVPSWRMLAKAVRQLDGGLFNRIIQGHPHNI